MNTNIISDMRKIQDACSSMDGVSCQVSIYSVCGLKHWSISINFWFGGDIKKSISIDGIFNNQYSRKNKYQLRLLANHGFKNLGL